MKNSKKRKKNASIITKYCFHKILDIVCTKSWILFAQNPVFWGHKKLYFVENLTIKGRAISYPISNSKALSALTPTSGTYGNYVIFVKDNILYCDYYQIFR